MELDIILEEEPHQQDDAYAKYYQWYTLREMLISTILLESIIHLIDVIIQIFY